MHARTAITRPGRYLTHAHSHITRAETAISVERTQNSGTLLNSCLRERKLTFLFIPFILHCQTSKSNESGTVTVKEAWELAKFLGTSYVENSATTGENVKDVVHTALRVVADQRKLQRSKCRCHRLFKWINKCKHRKWRDWRQAGIWSLQGDKNSKWKKKPLFSHNVNSPHKLTFGWNIVDGFV